MVSDTAISSSGQCLGIGHFIVTPLTTLTVLHSSDKGNLFRQKPQPLTVTIEGPVFISTITLVTLSRSISLDMRLLSCHEDVKTAQ